MCGACPPLPDCLYKAVVQTDVSGYVGCTTPAERKEICRGSSAAPCRRGSGTFDEHGARQAARTSSLSNRRCRETLNSRQAECGTFTDMTGFVVGWSEPPLGSTVRRIRAAERAAVGRFTTAGPSPGVKVPAGTGALVIVHSS